MSESDRSALATELIKVALNPDRLRALLRIVDHDDPGCLVAMESAIHEMGLTRNL